MSAGAKGAQSTPGSTGLPNVLPSIAPSLAQPSAAALGAQNMQALAQQSPTLDLAKLIPQLQQMQAATKASAPQLLTQPQQALQSIHPQVLQMMLPYFTAGGKP